MVVNLWYCDKCNCLTTEIVGASFVPSIWHEKCGYPVEWIGCYEQEQK